MSGNGTLFEYLVLSLNTVCGRWLREGERVRNPGTTVPTFPAKAQAMDPWNAWGFGEKLRVRGFTNTAAGMPTTTLADEILMDGDGQVRALICLGGNPVAAWPDQLKTIEAMRKLDLLVQIDIKMSATAKLADYVIAPRHSLEMPGITLSQDYLSLYGVGFGYPEAYGQYTPKVVEPPEGSDLIEEWEFFYETARRMGLQLELKLMGLTGPATGQPIPLDMQNKPSSEDIFEILMRDARISFDELKRHPHGALFPEPAVRVAAKDEGWTGRLEVGDAGDDGRTRASRRTSELRSTGRGGLPAALDLAPDDGRPTTLRRGTCPHCAASGPTIRPSCTRRNSLGTASRPAT